MNLGNAMYSPVGFGVYGNSAADTLLSLGKGLVTGAVGQVAGPVEITTPAALSGAKLTSGFKIIEEGTQYKIVLDAPIPGLSSFAGKVITGKDAVRETIGPVTIEFIPAPPNYVPFIIGGAVAVAALAFFMMRKPAPVAARKRKKSKKRRRRRR